MSGYVCSSSRKRGPSSSCDLGYGERDDQMNECNAALVLMSLSCSPNSPRPSKSQVPHDPHDPHDTCTLLADTLVSGSGSPSVSHLLLRHSELRRPVMLRGSSHYSRCPTVTSSKININLIFLIHQRSLTEPTQNTVKQYNILIKLKHKITFTLIWRNYLFNKTLTV